MEAFDIEKKRQQPIIVVRSIRIAEQLIYMYGLRSLRKIEKSRFDEGKRVFIFQNTPALFDTFQELIINTNKIINENLIAEPEIIETVTEPEYVESVVIPETITAVNDADILGEESALPKKRGRKKKVVEVEING